MKILVVDDETSMLKLISVSLESQGHSILTAENGNEGLAVAIRENPRLIILDLMMPEMSGLEMLRELRQTSDVPVIILSAYPSDENMEKARELGIECFLTKPFEPETLMETINVVASFL